MKITILGGGNIGSAIACGLSLGSVVSPKDITIVDVREQPLAAIKAFNNDINTSLNDYSSIVESDIVIVAVKPWMVESVISTIKDKMDYSRQIFISIAANVPFCSLTEFLDKDNISLPKIFRVIPNTAIAVRASMTMISSYNGNDDDKKIVQNIFNDLGVCKFIEEKQLAAATALASCGIAYALRYIRAAMIGGTELGFYPEESKEIVTQTVLGAAELLKANKSHPEIEIDKVTTPAGITIKGINEMELAGFTSAVVRGLKASC